MQFIYSKVKSETTRSAHIHNGNIRKYVFGVYLFISFFLLFSNKIVTNRVFVVRHVSRQIVKSDAHGPDSERRWRRLAHGVVVVTRRAARQTRIR